MPRPRKPARRRTAAKVKPWDALGVSRSTYFRQKRRRAAGTKPAARRAVVGPAGGPPELPPSNQRRQAIAEAFKTSREAEVRIDLDQRIGEAVDQALVRNALTQLDVMLANLMPGAKVIHMAGTSESWAACARALHKAGY